jgi:HK97 family phage portal protein
MARLFSISQGKISPIKAGRGNPLLDMFHGIIRTTTDFRDDPEGYAEAYAASIWAYRCITAKAYAVGEIELQVKSLDDEWIDSSGNIVEERPTNYANQHPLQRVLDAGAVRLKRNLIYDYNIFGQMWIEPTTDYLFRLNPLTMQIEADEVGIYAYKQYIGGSEFASWHPDELVRVTGYNPVDDVVGLSPMQWVLQEIGIEFNISAFVESFFKNDATPSGLLLTDQSIEDTDYTRIRRWWRKVFKGVDNRFKMGFMDKGFTYQQITPNMADLAIQPLREETRREIAALFGVPPVIALATDAANYAVSAEMHKHFYSGTVRPDLNYIVDELNIQLTPRYGDNIKIVADYSTIDVLQENALEVTQQVQAGFSSGFMSLNEAREKKGLPPLAQDYFYIPGYGMFTEEQLGEARAQPMPAGSPFGLSLVPMDQKDNRPSPSEIQQRLREGSRPTAKFFQPSPRLDFFGNPLE